jgi:hypothetical protein
MLILPIIYLIVSGMRFHVGRSHASRRWRVGIQYWRMASTAAGMSVYALRRNALPLVLSWSARVGGCPLSSTQRAKMGKSRAVVDVVGVEQGRPSDSGSSTLTRLSFSATRRPCRPTAAFAQTSALYYGNQPTFAQILERIGQWADRM